MPTKLPDQESLITDFINQVELLGHATPELQQHIAELLASKRSVLLARTGRKRDTAMDQRDGDIYKEHVRLREAGVSIKNIEEALGMAYRKSPERIKSIVQWYKNLLE
jgi:hypothetical protein